MAGGGGHRGQIGGLFTPEIVLLDLKPCLIRSKSYQNTFYQLDKLDMNHQEHF